MRKQWLVFLCVIVLSLMVVTPTFAGYIWCATDPNIKLPGGGVAHLWVAVRQENVGAPLTLYVVAPAGSRIVGSTHGINIILTDGAPNEITVSEAAGFPVQLWIKLRGDNLQPGVVTLEDGSGSATWTW